MCKGYIRPPTLCIVLVVLAFSVSVGLSYWIKVKHVTRVW